MDLTQAYYNGANVPDADSYYGRWTAEGAAFRAARPGQFDVPYGDTVRQSYDLFEPDDAAQGTLVFIHGGYWRSSAKSDWSQLAAGPMARGWRVAMPGYDLCPNVTVPQITQQMVRALGVIADHLPGPLRIAGHSAGGHLTARMLDAAWGAPWQARVERAVPISPVADLLPLLQTDMNADLRLDAQTASAESPIHQAAPETPVTVWVGANERPVFLEQAEWLVSAWGCDKVIAPDRNHYDVIEDLKNPGSVMCETILG